MNDGRLVDGIRKWFDVGIEEMMGLWSVQHCLGASWLTLVEKQRSSRERTDGQIA